MATAPSFLDLPLRLTRHAPVLLLPRALDTAFCRHLMAQFTRTLPTYQSDGYTTDGYHKESGDFRVEHDGSYGKITQIVLRDPGLVGVLDDMLVKRVHPAIETAFQARSNSREFWRLACYPAPGGFIGAHRDNNSRPTHHRNFTMTINLNAGEYEGGELRFPEFGPDLYAVERGTAVVWSAALLHEVLPVTRGARYVAAVHLSLLKDQGRFKVADVAGSPGT
ncbi:MAG TPA: 2OG-Fe(II) oxygenase [Kiloniellales bacterium]|nr:2OG-Fe(II) oxygenase [Kiloniellales bacterium]